jgi:CRISPR/Cas system-associated exonuclease Cas4 (RecB family)
MKFDDPTPTKCEMVSPTLANDLLACPYRVAWRLDTRYRYLRRPRPRSELGRVAHAVVEDIGKGLLDSVKSPQQAEELVESSWDIHLNESVRRLVKEWAPSVPPNPEDWPGFYLTKIRVLRRALRLLASHSQTHAKSHVSSIEKTLTDPDSGIHGRPDRVEELAEGTCVVDLKTGLTQTEPSANQRIQLLIYAYLVFKATGIWPSRIAIEDPSGRRWQEGIKTEDVTDLIARISEARVAFNRSSEVGKAREVARPEPETCRWCSYKPVCEPYWVSLTTDWEHGSVAGAVLSFEGMGEKASLMSILAVSPVDTAGEEWTVTAPSSLPAENLQMGAEVAVTGAEVTEAARFLRARWSTTLSLL